jgi:hypothetical protein
MTEVRERLLRASERVTPPDRAFERMLERGDRKKRQEKIVAAAVALVVAFAVSGGALTLLSGLLRGDVQPASDGADKVDPRLVLGPGQYVYLKVRSSEAVDGHIRDEETWWALDGSGTVRNDSTRQDKYPTPASGVYAAGRFPVEVDLSQLSTDPQGLAAQLEAVSPFADLLAEGDEPEPERQWRVIAALLDLPNATPELRAALFEVAAALPGVRTTGDVEDPVGRSATALSYTNEGEGITWTEYFDPATRQLMSWTSVYEGNRPAWVVYDSAIVGAPGVQPTRDQWLFPHPSPSLDPGSSVASADRSS